MFDDQVATIGDLDLSKAVDDRGLLSECTTAKGSVLGKEQDIKITDGVSDWIALAETKAGITVGGMTVWLFWGAFPFSKSV